MPREQTTERATRGTTGAKMTGTSRKRGRAGEERARVQTVPAREQEQGAAVERAESMPDTSMPDTGHLPGEPTVRWAHVPVPIGVRVHAPRLPVPSPRATAQQAVRVAEAVRSNLPPTERLAYYGGIGILAAVGALEWPVAAAVGVGFWLTGRRGQQRAAAQREARWREAPEESHTPATM